MSQPSQQRRRAGVKCRLCDKWFGTNQALASHAAAKRHCYCKTCHRVFQDVVALEQHSQNSPAHAESPMVINPPARPVVVHLVPVEQQVALPVAVQNLAAESGITVAAPAPPRPIVCRGNAYTSLSAADATALHAFLLLRCHTPHRLRTEGYVLAADVLTAPTAHGAAGPRVLTPRHDPYVAKRKAVVLDCEMVGTSDSRSDDEVVALSVIDFFTGETLINKFIKPLRRVTNWRSHITGITPTVMSVAVSRGEALLGRKGAREKLWEHVDELTVIIGHSVNFDLQALGVVHGKIVDSAILTAEPVFCETRKIGSKAGLERLCQELLGLRIRAGGPTASKFHDSMEDVLAAREIVIWCLRYPSELQAWAARNWGPGKKGQNKDDRGGEIGDRDMPTLGSPRRMRTRRRRTRRSGDCGGKTWLTERFGPSLRRTGQTKHCPVAG